MPEMPVCTSNTCTEFVCLFVMPCFRYLQPTLRRRMSQWVLKPRRRRSYSPKSQIFTSIASESRSVAFSSSSGGQVIEAVVACLLSSNLLIRLGLLRPGVLPTPLSTKLDQATKPR
jgi:hypothetical protein